MNAAGSVPRPDRQQIFNHCIYPVAIHWSFAVMAWRTNVRPGHSTRTFVRLRLVADKCLDMKS
jgi:hypothetical protein